MTFSGEQERKGESLHGCELFLSGTAHRPCDSKMDQIPFYALQFNIAWFVPNFNYCKSVMWFTATAIEMGRMHPILPSGQISPEIKVYVYIYRIRICKNKHILTCIMPPSEPTSATSPLTAARRSIVGEPWKRNSGPVSQCNDTRTKCLFLPT